MTRRLLALGDSYTIGECVGVEACWPTRLAALIREAGIDLAETRVVAQTGWTTDELEDAIDEARPRGPFDLVTLLVGVNDQYRSRDPENYRTNLRPLVRKAVGLAGGDATRVIMLSIPDWGVTPYAASGDPPRITREIDAYNAVNQAEASRAGVEYVDITPCSRRAADDSSLLASDGLHPSQRMYDEWAHLAAPRAIAILGRETGR